MCCRQAVFGAECRELPYAQVHGTLGIAQGSFAERMYRHMDGRKHGRKTTGNQGRERQKDI